MKRIIYVKWFDASFISDQQTVDQMKDYFEIESVGHFVKENKHSVTLASEYVEEYGTWRHIHHIPKANIVKRKFIKS